MQKALLFSMLFLTSATLMAAAGNKIKPVPKARFEEIILEVKVNQQEVTKNMLMLLSERDVLWMSEEDIFFWRVVPPKDADYHNHFGIKYYKISKFEGIKTALDKQLGTLQVDFPANFFVATEVNKEPPPIVPHLAPNGAYLNYEFFVQGGQGNTQVDTTLDFGLFNRYGTGNLSVLGRNINDGNQFVRLDTNWTIDKPFSMASIRLGDSISRAGAWGRPIRFGGVQWSTNFATQPEFITTPLLNLSAATSLPSTLDLYINNVQTYQRQLAPGAFSINNLPLVSGAGDARLVVRDIFGREQVIVQPYYASRSLLREGLTDYSYEIGQERLNYTVQSNHYDRLSVSGTHRYGITNRFTGEVHADAQEGRASAGLSGTVKVGNFGILDASVAASNNEDGGGALGVIGFDRQANYLSFGARTQITSKNFSYQGMREGEQVPVSLTNAFVGYNLRQYGSLSFNYVNQHYRSQTEAEILSVNYNKTLSRDWYLNFNAFKSLQDNNYNLGLNLTYFIADRTSATLTTNKTNGDDQTLLQVQRNLPLGEGFGYRALVEVQNNRRLEAGLTYQNAIGTYGVEAANVQGKTLYRGSASGSVARVDGENYLSRRLGESFAVVDVAGYKDIKVYSQNQLVGTSNQQGKLLVPNLRAYQRNFVSIDPKDLPIEAEIAEYRLEAIPYFKSADYVKFVIDSDRSATLRIVTAAGEPVPAGAMVKLDDNPNQVISFPVANDGVVYMRGFKAHSHLVVKWSVAQCEFDVDFPVGAEPTPDLGQFVCQ